MPELGLAAGTLAPPFKSRCRHLVASQRPVLGREVIRREGMEEKQEGNAGKHSRRSLWTLGSESLVTCPRSHSAHL